MSQTPGPTSERSDDALEAAQRLRRVAAHLAAGVMPDPADAAWHAASLEAYLAAAADGVTADQALAVDTARGALPWWRREAINARDEELRQAAAEHFADRDPGEQAAELLTAWTAYEGAGWQHDRDAEALPVRIAGSLRGRLWTAAKCAPIPRSKRQIKRALGHETAD